MTDPLRLPAEGDAVLRQVLDAAIGYLDELHERPARTPGSEASLEALATPLPEEGSGATAALADLTGSALEAAPRSTGPRWFGFVTGGATPAALGADWLASALDQNASLWVHSPLAARLEAIGLDWLKQLFGLPSESAGVLTDGATMAHFAALAAARRWAGERRGVDVDADGLAGLPPVPVLSSGFIHSSTVKVIGMLGLGRSSLRRLTADEVGRLDLDALERELERLDGAPAILVATAGEVNSGQFDPIAAMAELAERHDAWLHVDGAFGLFAALSERTAHLVDGVERAHSVISDGHKWLNVPYDCGFAFVREPGALLRTFGGVDAPYLNQPAGSNGDGAQPSFQAHGPQGSQRARSLAVWATLRAYGRSGYRELVERHMALARRVAQHVDEAPELERLAEVPLNVVCFRARPPGLPEAELDGFNLRLEEAIHADGRVFLGTTRYAGRVAFRPAICNWRIDTDDVDLMVDVVRELAAALAPA